MSLIIDQDRVSPSNPRNPVAAALLSFFPGLGQLYNGQPKKGILFLVIDLLIPILFGITGAVLNLNGFVVMIVVAIAFILYRMADGFIVARRLKNYELKPFNRWYVYLIFALFLMGLKTLLDISTSAGIQTFNIPTPSMAPTLVPGDKVVAQFYKDKDKEIQLGDIVVYNPPNGSKFWISRIVALPSDSIEVIDGMVFVNGQANKATKIKEYSFGNEEVIEFEEGLQNQKKVKTLRHKKNLYPDGRTKEKTFVPANEYYLISDNRDDAIDSRYFGAIKKEDILGKIIYTLWSSSSDSEK